MLLNTRQRRKNAYLMPLDVLSRKHQGMVLCRLCTVRHAKIMITDQQLNAELFILACC
jgi:hypothetical protein